MKYDQLIIAAVIGLLVTVSVISCSKESDEEVSSGEIELSKSSVSPGENLEISSESFNSNAVTYVVFKDEKDNETEVEAYLASDTTIKVTVPPYLNVDQFQITSGEVSVSVVQELVNNKKIIFGASEQLKIADLPQTGESKGVVTLEVLKQEKVFIALAIQEWQIIEDASSGSVDTSLLRTNLLSLMDKINTLETLLQPLVNGEVQKVDIGVISDKEVYLDLDAMGLLDRMFIAYHFNTPSTAPSSASVVQSGEITGCLDISTCFREEFNTDIAKSTQEIFNMFTKFNAIASSSVGLGELAIRSFGNSATSEVGGGTFGAIIFYTTAVVPSVIGASMHSFDPPFISLELGRAPTLGSYQPSLSSIEQNSKNYMRKYNKGEILGDAYIKIDKTELGSAMNDVKSVGESTITQMDLSDPNSVYSLAFTNSETIYDNFIVSLADSWLGVSVVGDGGGMVSSSPLGIDCGADCSEIYNFGTLVTLTAVPETGSTFAGWTGACSGTGACAITMDKDATATAEFTLASFSGAWDGNYSWTGTGDGGCTYNDKGALSMTISINGSTFSGPAAATGIELRNLTNCEVTSYTSSEGSVSGIISGSKLTGIFTFPIAETGGTFSLGWTGTFSENNISGSFQ